jgi:hypothetical protein
MHCAPHLLCKYESGPEGEEFENFNTATVIFLPELSYFSLQMDVNASLNL